MIFAQALAFLLDPANWVTTEGHVGILQRIVESLIPTGIAIVVIVLIAVPIGFLIGHTGKGATVAVLISNIARALPTLGLLSIFILIMGIGFVQGIIPALIVLVILGIPPMLAGTYAGVGAVDRTTIDAARAMGMTEGQIVARVEWPLAAPLIIGGLRSAVLQVFATTTVASTFAYGGLGRYLIDGIASNQFDQVLAGALLVTAIALLLEGVLALVQYLAAPRGVPRARAARRPRARNSASAAPGTPIQEGTPS
jgi:osmoprotectant transport system permease protein